MNKRKITNVSNDNQIDKCKQTLDYLLIEYNDIIANGRSIDTKAGLFLTLLFAILPFYIQVIDVNFLRDIFSFDQPNISKSFFLFFFIISLLFYITTFVCFVMALFPRDFYKFTNNTSKLSNRYYLENSFLNENIVKEYQDKICELSIFISRNLNRSHKKSKWFKRALLFFVIYSALILLVIILKLCLKF